MANSVKIVKKQKPKYHLFDEEVVLTEARNVELLFNLHLSRCASEQTAEYLENIFLRIGEKFGKKKLDLLNEVE